MITILAQKGGTGKTTLTVSLAVAAYKAGLSVAVFDLDSQATAAKWDDRREASEPVVISMQPERLPHYLDKAQQGGADLVVIDTPPRLDPTAYAAVEAADIVLVPCLPAINDLETLDATMRLIRIAGGRQTFVVLNSVPPRGQKPQQAQDIVEAKGIPLAPVMLGNRVAFPDSAALGLSPQEYEPTGKAAAEIEELFTFLAEYLTREEVHGHQETRLAGSLA